MALLKRMKCMLAHESHVTKERVTIGRGTKKTPVVGIKQRDGMVRAETVKRVDKQTLQGLIKRDVSSQATIMTDEWFGYIGLSKNFEKHEVVNHSSKEYVRKGNIHTNSIESFWALVKRGIVGIYHHVSPAHLDTYIDEFEFRLNSKDITDPERLGLMLTNCEGRLTYDELVGS